MRRGGRIILLLALTLGLTACGAPPETAPAPGEAVTETVPAPDVAAPPAEEPAAGPVEETIFPRSFRFASGAGGWSTELEVAADGSFIGMYLDSDNDATYICHFSGNFSQPVKVDDLTYSMRLESIEQEETEGEEITSGCFRFIGSSPHGLKNADEIFIYLPGSRQQDLPESFSAWANTFCPLDTEDGRTQSGEDRLTRYGLYNVSEELGFVSMEE